MRILLTRKQGGLGDVLCMLPAVAALRAEDPGATLDLALPAEYAELLRGRVDGVRLLAWDHRKFRPRWRRLSSESVGGSWIPPSLVLRRGGPASGG